MAAVTPASAAPPRHHRLLWLGALAAAVLAGLAIGLVAAREPSQERSSADDGSGHAVAVSRHVAPFTGVALAGANLVTVRVGAPQAVVVRGDDNLVGRVTTKVQRGELVIGNRGSFRTKAPMSVDVTVPTLDSLALGGSGQIVVEGVNAPSFAVALPGSGSLFVSGTTGRLDARLAGSGQMQLGELTSRDATVAIGGSGTVLVNVTRSLDASVSGSGVVAYFGGPPSVTTHVTGSGTVAPA
jgi:hypothetical protein